MAKKLFWLWLIILLLLNVVPLGNKVNEQLSTRVFEGKFRLDYLVHAVTFLCFAGIYGLKWIRGEKIFRDHELPKMISIILISSILFEAIQYCLPYRTWNPFDLLYNLLGAAVASVSMYLLNQRQRMQGQRRSGSQ